MADAAARAAALLKTARLLIRSLECLSNQLEEDLNGVLTDAAELGSAHIQALFNELRSENRQLREALEGRSVIERAKGMLMILHDCDEEAAFHMLVALSQRHKRKVRDVALELVSSTHAPRQQVAADGAPADAGKNA